MNSEEMLALAGRVEQANGPERELDFDIADAVLGPIKPPYRRGYCEKYTASLDAAMTLVPQGQDWYVTSIRPLTGRFAGAIYKGSEPSMDYAEAATPALALCAAALRARAQ